MTYSLELSHFAFYHEDYLVYKLMAKDDPMFDHKLIVSHSDLYFMVQRLCPISRRVVVV